MFVEHSEHASTNFKQVCRMQKNPNNGISGTCLATEFPKQPGGCKTTIVSALNNQTEGSSPRRIRFDQHLETSNFAPAVQFTQTGGIYSQLACNSFE